MELTRNPGFDGYEWTTNISRISPRISKTHDLEFPKPGVGKFSQFPTFFAALFFARPNQAWRVHLLSKKKLDTLKLLTGEESCGTFVKYVRTYTQYVVGSRDVLILAVAP